MILIIDTIERFKIEIGLIQSNNSVIPDRPGAGSGIQTIETKSQSSDLLPALKRILSIHKVTLNSLEAILVNSGPGSYTGVRVGVATANALAWSLDIPVVGYRNGELETAIAEISNRKNIERTFNEYMTMFVLEDSHFYFSAFQKCDIYSHFSKIALPLYDKK